MINPKTLQPNIKNKNAYKNMISFDNTYNYYKNIAVSSFKWDNLPLGLDDRLMERMMYYHGELLFFEDDMQGQFVLPFSGMDYYNVYGEPTAFHAIGIGYTKLVKAEDCVIIRNNPYSTPTRNYVRFMCEKIYNVSRAIDINIQNSKTPRIIGTTKKTFNTVASIIKNADKNESAIFFDNALNSSNSSIDVTDISVDLIAGELIDLQNELENKLLTYLGIENANVDKKERLITDEVNSNEEFTQYNIDLMLEYRQKACDEINEKFGLNVTVERRVKHDKVKINTVCKTKDV